MGPRCAVTGLALVLFTGITCAVANNPSGTDSSAKTSNVKNAPFSADVITEYDRALDNGAHIHRESRGKIFRDSQGRMRTESQPSAFQLGAEKSDRITINDPVKLVIVYLNPKTKTATVVRFGEVGPNPPGAAAKQSKGKSKIHLSGPPAIESGASDTLAGPNPPSGQAALPQAQPAQASGVPTSKMNATIFSGTPATIVPLGTRIIEGVTVTGTRTTRTINPGTMGNDKPIVSITDTWVSPDLKVTVLTETDDGQDGHSTMKLVNIVRSEPNAALFQIPADYTVKENATAANAVH